MQLLYPIFSKTVNYQLKAKHFQLLPLLISDSSQTGVDTRVMSIFYPSIFRAQRQVQAGTEIRSFKFFELASNISLLGISRSSTGLYVENNMFFFIWYKRDEIAARTRFMVFPFYGYWANKSDTTSVLFPIYYNRKGPDFVHTRIGLLYNHKRSSFENRTVSFPFWWKLDKYQKNDTLKSRVLFPVYWSKTNRTLERKTLFPLVYSLRDSSHKSLTILPFFTTSTHFNNSQQKLNVYPIYWSSKNTKESRKTLFPIWWAKKQKLADGSYLKKRTLFPLYWSAKSNTLSNSVVFPVFYRFSNSRIKSLTILPLFSSGRHLDSSRNYLSIMPFYWHLGTAKSNRDFIFPVFWKKKEYSVNDTLCRTAFFPVYFSKRATGVHNQTFFPLVFSRRDTNYRSLTVFPIFSTGHSTDLTQSKFAVFPLYWSRKNGVEFNRTFFPFWWAKQQKLNDGLMQQKSTIFPIYWSLRSQDISNTTVFPILFKYKNKTRYSLTILPLLVYGKTTDSKAGYLAITPLFWHINTPTAKMDVLFPLFWKTSKFTASDTLVKTTILPIYFAEKSRQVNNRIVFPLVFSLRDSSYKSLTVFPFFSTGQSADEKIRKLTVFPIYWSQKNNRDVYRVVFPLWWSKHRELSDGAVLEQRTLFPFYWSSKNGLTNNKAVLPLFFSFKNRFRQSTTIFPLLSFGRTADSSSSYLAFTPFYWERKTRNSESYTLLPLWRKKLVYTADDDTVKTSTLYPIYWSLHDSKRDNRILFPLFFDLKNENRRFVAAIPFFTYHKELNSINESRSYTPFYWHLTRVNKTSDIVFPIYWQTHRLINGESFKSNTFFPIYWSVVGGAKNHKVLFPVAFFLKNQNYQSVTLFPLFSTGHSTNKLKSHFNITPLFWHIKTPRYETNLLFPIWVNSNICQGDDTAKLKVLFPIYFRTKTATTSEIIVLPIVFGLSNYRSSWLAVFPFYYSGTNKAIQSKTMAVTPFYWHREGLGGRSDVFFPLFWKSKKYLAADTITKTKLFPLYWAKKSNSEDKKLLLPLVYSAKDTVYESFTLFPLFSVGHSVDDSNRHFMITPFFGNFQSKDGFKTFLFPLFSAKHKGDETNTAILWFMYRKTKRPDYAKTSILWPICERLKSEELSTFRIAPLVWHFKTDTAKTTAFIPFYYRYKSVTKHSTSLALGMFKHENILGSHVATSLLWRLYSSEKYTNGEFETRLFYLLYANINRKDKQEKSLFPFYHKVKHGNGDRSKSVFLGFYNYFKQYKPDIATFYEEERIFWFIRLRSNYNKLKQEGKEQYLK